MNEANLSAPEDLPLGEFLTYRLNILSNLLNRQTERFLQRHHGIAIPDWRVLFLLARGGSMSVRELSALSKMDRALVSRVTKRLAQAGLISSKISSVDARLVELSISGSGLDLYHQILPHALTRQQVLQSVLGEQKLADLNLAVDQLTQFAEEKGDDLF